MYTHFLVSLILVMAGRCAAMRYDGYHAYRVGPFNTQQQLQWLLTFARTEEASQKVEVVEDELQEGESAEVLVAGDRIAAMETALTAAQLSYSLMEENVQESIDRQQALNEELSMRFPSDASKYYMSWQEQLEYVKELAADSARAQYSSLGASYEGRELPLISINADRPELPGVWIDAGLHSREWLTHATALYLANKILTGSGDRARELRRNYRIYIAPNLNPDGYIFSWLEARFFRKNRRYNNDGFCIGVDLNRNFHAYFSNCGLSEDPCDDHYQGPSPASEVEVQNLVRGMTRVQRDGGGLRMYLSLHSYGQRWVMPWAGTDRTPRDYNELRRVARRAVNAIRQESGSTFQVGTPRDLLASFNASAPGHSWARGCTGGTAMDWAKQEGEFPWEGADVKYSYTLELRPARGCCARAFEGFIPDPSAIAESGQEIFAGVYAAVRAMN